MTSTRVQSKGVVTRHRHATVERVARDGVVLEEVVVGWTEFVGHQDPALVAADMIALDLGPGDAHQMDPLTAIARDLPLR
jgi:hypothetical protein